MTRVAQGAAMVGLAVLALAGCAPMAAPVEAGGPYRGAPVRPIAALIAEARAAAPPVEAGEFLPSDLVDVRAIEPGIRLDLRYATPDNFLGVAIYPEARAMLQRPVAEALARVHRALAADGLGLLIHDAYRPWWVSHVFWHAVPPEKRGFVADPARGSRHNRGAAVDLTLVSLKTGRPLAMPSAFDSFGPAAAADFAGGTAVQRAHRDRLRTAMAAEGFAVLPNEWWHFDHRGWARYPIGNQDFSANVNSN